MHLILPQMSGENANGRGKGEVMGNITGKKKERYLNWSFLTSFVSHDEQREREKNSNCVFI